MNLLLGAVLFLAPSLSPLICPCVLGYCWLGICHYCWKITCKDSSRLRINGLAPPPRPRHQGGFAFVSARCRAAFLVWDPFNLHAPLFLDHPGGVNLGCNFAHKGGLVNKTYRTYLPPLYTCCAEAAVWGGRVSEWGLGLFKFTLTCEEGLLILPTYVSSGLWFLVHLPHWGCQNCFKWAPVSK